MHTIQQASDIILRHILNPASESIPIKHSLGKILAEDIYASDDVPDFDQSAVDGFAIQYEQYAENETWQVVGEMKAGDYPFELKNTSERLCAKIFTGASIPHGFNSVVMKEYAELLSDNIVKLKAHGAKLYQNIRKKGEEVRKGEIIFKKYTVIKPEHIAVITSIGKADVLVLKDIAIKIIVTGNELKDIEKEKKINIGEKFESNGIVLKSLIQKYFSVTTDYEIIKDDKDSIFSAMKQASQNYDIVITTGGVSVGDYDFTKPVIKELGFEILIDKVAQKPGKPFVFAVNNHKKIIFGLPGNPRAVLSCFYWYVLRFLRASYRLPSNWYLPVVKFPMQKDIAINDNKSRILFISIENGQVIVSEKQDSHMLVSAAKADGLIVLHESKRQGDLVEVYLI